MSDRSGRVGDGCTDRGSEWPHMWTFSCKISCVGWAKESAPNRVRKHSPGPCHPDRASDRRAMMKSTRTCSVAECSRPHRALGMCKKHHAQYKRTGSPHHKPARTCSVPDCSAPHSGLGFCRKHHARFKKHGDPHTFLGPARMTGLTLAERIEHYSADEGDCRVWTGSIHPNGYGRVTVAGRGHWAHRAAWSAVHGEIPKGLVIRHSCDNPPCVKIEHLLLGTQKENCEDRDSRGRSGLAKLNASQVIEIAERLNRGEKCRPISEEFGVSYRAIYSIKSGRGWRSVLDNHPLSEAA